MDKSLNTEVNLIRITVGIKCVCGRYIELITDVWGNEDLCPHCKTVFITNGKMVVSVKK